MSYSVFFVSLLFIFASLVIVWKYYDDDKEIDKF